MTKRILFSMGEKMMKRKLLLVFCLSLFLSAAPAMADLPSVQQVLDYITVGGPSSVNAGSDYLADTEAEGTPYDSYWNISASSSSVATMIIEVAGNASGNGFGIFERNNAGNTAEIFNGATSAGGIFGTATLTILSDTINGGFDVYVDKVKLADFKTDWFGYYLDGPGGTFYSESSLNPFGADHMLAYQGTGDTVQIKSYGDDGAAWAYAPGLWTPSEYILAFEDLPASNTDWDYNDFMVMVESVNPVPVPGAVLLGMLGLSAVGIKLRRHA